MSCLRRGFHATDCADRTSGWDAMRRALLSPTAEYPVQPAPIVPRVPVWTLVAIVSGLALMAFGVLLNDPVSLWIWMMIRS